MEDIKQSKKLLWVSALVFLAEFLGIIGWYWIFGGHAGDATLTISRYVGLNLWSTLAFCACNMAIIVMLVYYLLTQASKRGFLWRFLMYAFALAFMALSISPHVPDESMPATIHRFFAGAMFIIISLIGILTLTKATRKVTLVYSLLFTIYAMFFLICDVLRVDFFMNSIFWYESAYIFAFFGLILCPEKRK